MRKLVRKVITKSPVREVIDRSPSPIRKLSLRLLAAVSGGNQDNLDVTP